MTSLELAIETLTDIAEQTGRRLLKVESALLVLVADESLPAATRAGIALALAPDGDAAA